MALCVDAFEAALREYDRSAWNLLTALHTRIHASAELLVRHLEKEALQPAVTGGGNARDCSSSFPEASAVCHLTSQVRASALCPPLPADSTASSLRVRLEKELAALIGLSEQSSAEGEDENNAGRAASPVFLKLSPYSQAVLVVSALWMSAKLWSTVPESATLTGLLACLVRNQQQRQEIVRQEESASTAPAGPSDFSGAGASLPPAGAAGGSCTPPNSSPQRGAVVSSTANASTPLDSVLQYEEKKCYHVGGAEEKEKVRDGRTCTTAEEDLDGYVLDALRLGDYDDYYGGGHTISNDLLPHPAVSYEDVADAVDVLVRDVEEAEMLLLRCSDYSIPM